jgi:hypothetical protein
MNTTPEQSAADPPETVWVVTSRPADSPHARVEGVYNREQPARDHRDDLADNCHEHGLVAWDVHEREVQ